MSAVTALSRIDLVCADPARLARFYCNALGFVQEAVFDLASASFGAWSGIRGATAHVVSLRLGQQRLDLMGIAPAGSPYPAGVDGRSPLFQHFAIVVADMDKAYAHLTAQPGWAPISLAGPERLPATSGGVTAFKFRDPEGHPLELIEFPASPKAGAAPAQTCMGIDHSAISVSDTARSTAFYAGLGLRRSAGSLNRGPEQARLDAVDAAVVEVTGLALPGSGAPHVELLRYRNAQGLLPPPCHVNDIAATQMAFSVGSDAVLSDLCGRYKGALVSGPLVFDGETVRALLRDPDGHLLSLEARPEGSAG